MRKRSIVEQTVGNFMTGVCGEVHMRLAKKQTLEDYHARNCTNEYYYKYECKNVMPVEQSQKHSII